MANDFFKFKQFTIHQGRCAMKVTTMACIQGAWLPNIEPRQILDIGAGTGLLSLMAAQKYNCEIDSVEIEQDAFDQLNENIELSPWNNKINCFHDDIKHFARQSGKKYDFIISNPPFYKGQLNSPFNKINQARHDAGLTIEELIDSAFLLLHESGRLSILLPPAETKTLADLCAHKSLFLSHQLVISDSEKKEPRAIITILSKKTSIFHLDKMIIKSENGDYTQDFISLLEAYYLSL